MESMSDTVVVMIWLSVGQGVRDISEGSTTSVSSLSVVLEGDANANGSLPFNNC